MKKIMAVAAMAAMVAGAAFAVDVSGQVKATGNAVAGSNKDGDTVKVLTLDNLNNSGDTKLSFSASGEKAGASFDIKEGGNIADAGIWFKPVDMVKVSVGKSWTCINMEEIDWSNIMDFGGTGYAVEVTPVAGLTADVYLLDGSWSYGAFMTGKTISALGAKVSYGADFGTVTVLAGYTGTTKVALGYAGNIAGITLKADAVTAINADGKFTDVNGDLYVGATVAGVSLKGYVKETTNLAGADPVIGLGFKAAAGYTLGAVNLGLTVKSDNVLADYLGLAVNTSVGFSVGECSIGTGLNLTFNVDADTSVKYEVPLSFTVAL